MLTKLRYWNLQLGKALVPFLYLLGVLKLYEGYGLFAAGCAWFLCLTIGKSVLDSMEIVSCELKVK